jgi:protein arginine N-methyltransferase 2
MDANDNSSAPQDDSEMTHKRLRPGAVEERIMETMLEACATGNINLAYTLIQDEKKQQDLHSISQPLITVTHQDEITGLSPLMVAAKNGHLELCKLLVQEGAPWNAIDRTGNCAGNYATNEAHWDIVEFLVDVGVQAELILGMAIRNDKRNREKSGNNTVGLPFDYESHTKPDYIHRNIRYNTENTAILDQDDDAVMMEWERPLMETHAHAITSNGQMNKTVLNVGFGMGIIDTALQSLSPLLHVIVEAHPLVYKKMIDEGWDKRNNVRICYGKWQDVLPSLIMNENIKFDGIFYDTYGEHFTDFEDFHERIVTQCLAKNGIYSFFNGLCPDNLFFHGVACQCIKLQLGKLGLESEFVGKPGV